LSTGATFEATTLIDDRVIADIEACIPGVRKIFPVQAAVFDIAFHQLDLPYIPKTVDH
jgi:hypothetical protein